MYSLILIGLVLVLGMVVTPARAQAVCDTSLAPTQSVCNNNNSFSFIMPTTNTNGTPLNDFGTVRAVFGTMTPLCSPQGIPVVGATVRSLGTMGQLVTPLPNTTVSAKLGTLNMPDGPLRLSVQILDLTGNMSGCSGEVAFTMDNSTPSAPAGLKVGP